MPPVAVPRLQELRLPYLDIPGEMLGFPTPGVSQNHEKFGCNASVDAGVGLVRTQVAQVLCAIVPNLTVREGLEH